MDSPVSLQRLRRFAAALTGSTADGDRCIEMALIGHFDAAGHAPWDDGLYARICQAADDAVKPAVDAPPGCGRRARVVAALRGMELRQRAALLLHVLEDLSLEAIAGIVRCPMDTTRDLIASAGRALVRECQPKVLIIEDDLLTARQLGRIAARMGCSIVGVARRDADALAIAASTHPHLVIADVNLHKGGSGAWAAERIVEAHGANIVFVTAYPDLIRTKRLRAFPLINKPIDTPQLQGAILSAVAA